MANIVLDVSGEVVSGNTYIHWHWAARNRYANVWLWRIRSLTVPPVAPPDCRKRVTFECRRRRTIDSDNFVTGCKPIRDVLRRLNYIRDDSAKWGSFFYLPVITDRVPRLTITIEDL